VASFHAERIKDSGVDGLQLGRDNLDMLPRIQPINPSRIAAAFDQRLADE